jgi:hypothetical protein
MSSLKKVLAAHGRDLRKAVRPELKVWARAISKPKSKNKYGAVKVKLDGYTFDSRAEAKRYGELKLLQKAGEIIELKVHPAYRLEIGGKLIATYKPDFEYKRWLPCSMWGRTIEDVKSKPTAAKRDFILIKKLMKAIHNIDVEVISSSSLPNSGRKVAA